MATKNKATNSENAPKSISPSNAPEIQIAGKTSEILNNPPPNPAPTKSDVPASLPTDPAPVKGEVSAVPVGASSEVSPQVAGNLVDMMDTPAPASVVAPGVAPTATNAPGVPIPPTVATDPLIDSAETEPIKRGRGRPPGSKNKPQSPSTIADIVTAEATPNYGLMGEVVFDMSTNALAVGLGPEWLPKTPEERQLVSVSLGRYFETQKVKDIPPGMMLALVVTVYALPRLSQPSTSTKLKLGWTWLKSKFSRKNPFKVVASDEKEKV